MIRFIDLRDQIIDVEDYPVHFSFYDTTGGFFLTLCGQYQDWDSREDFLRDLENDDAPPGTSRWLPERERFLSLMPEWVK